MFVVTVTRLVFKNMLWLLCWVYIHSPRRLEAFCHSMQTHHIYSTILFIIKKNYGKFIRCVSVATPLFHCRNERHYEASNEIVISVSFEGFEWIEWMNGMCVYVVLIPLISAENQRVCITLDISTYGSFRNRSHTVFFLLIHGEKRYLSICQ